MGLASRGLCPPPGKCRRHAGQALWRGCEEEEVGADRRCTHTHRSQREEGDGEKNPSALKLGGGLERAGPVPPEQQLHSRRG